MAGAPPEALIAAAKRADWEPPEFLVAVTLPEAKVRGVLTRVGPRVLRPSDDLPGLDTDAVLPEIGVGADLDALEDLRARALVPLRYLRPGAAERPTATLQSWLLHSG